MSIKKGKADGKIYDIVDIDELNEKSKEADVYDNMAIIWNDTIYPKRNTTDDKPGVYLQNWGSYLKHPTEQEKPEYTAENVIDFNVETTKELIQKQNKLKNMEYEILTTPDNIFIPPLLDNDEPQMRGLKEAVIAKQCDINKYSDRFGSNFLNDKRTFSSSSITMKMLKRMATNLDIKLTLTFEDKDANVPNPMNKAISVSLLGGMGDIE